MHHIFKCTCIGRLHLLHILVRYVYVTSIEVNTKRRKTNIVLCVVNTEAARQFIEVRNALSQIFQKRVVPYHFNILDATVVPFLHNGSILYNNILYRAFNSNVLFKSKEQQMALLI